MLEPIVGLASPGARIVFEGGDERLLGLQVEPDNSHAPRTSEPTGPWSGTPAGVHVQLDRANGSLPNPRSRRRTDEIAKVDETLSSLSSKPASSRYPP